MNIIIVVIIKRAVLLSASHSLMRKNVLTGRQPMWARIAIDISISFTLCAVVVSACAPVYERNLCRVYHCSYCTLLSAEVSGGKNANLITNLRHKLGCFDERHVLAVYSQVMDKNIQAFCPL